MSTKNSVTRDPSSSDLVILREGDEVAFQIQVPNVVTGITGTPTMQFLKKGNSTDLSSTYLTGSTSVIGTDIVQTKQTTGLKKGNWVLSTKATVDGQTYVVDTRPLLVKRRDEE